MTPVPTLSWLRGLKDPALIELLQARPDLVVPAPSSLDALAHRLDTPPSVWRVLEMIDQFTLQILQALVVLGADHEAVSPAEVSTFLGKGATKKAVTAATTRLESLGIVRGGKELRVPRSVAAALGPYPGGLGPATGMTTESVGERLAECPERGRLVLEKLAEGSPLGSVAADAPIAPVISDLIGRGLLLRRDSGTVELPREVGLALRGNSPLGPLQIQPVTPEPSRREPDLIDRTAAGQSMAVLRIWRQMLDDFGNHAATVLKSGGIGVRDLRRLAKTLQLTEAVTGLHLELLAAAGLIAPNDPRGTRKVNLWTPTSLADEWIDLPDGAAWAAVALVWLDLRRDPSRAGQRDISDKLLNILSAELAWPRGPADRRWVLGVLAALPAGSGLTDQQVTEVLTWQAPLRGADRRDRVIGQVLADATELGVVAFGTLSTTGRALLGGEDEQVTRALESALPEPSDRILVQADLTVVGSGRLVPSLAGRLQLAAEVESAGSATVYRVTPESLRRALDAGMTTAELHSLFADHSTTPIPQSLTYLIDDIGRRHGVLRAGTAHAYVRCDDPVLIDTAIAQAASAGIILRRLAPTVAVTGSSLDDVIAELRRAGLAPSAEDHLGGIIDLARSPLRTKASLITHQRWREPAVPDAEQLGVLVARMRSADQATIVTGQSAGDALAELRSAAAAGGAVWIEYVNTEGAATRRLIEPLAISGGTVAAFDRLSGQMRTFALHRISGIRQAE
ncbi:DNA-binding protein [Nakamurella silvestris]|nr:DNA-binding protein [Nakamurella silvestris]